MLLVSTAGPRVYALGKVAELFEQLARTQGGAGQSGRGLGSVLLQVRFENISGKGWLALALHHMGPVLSTTSLHVLNSVFI